MLFFSFAVIVIHANANYIILWFKVYNFAPMLRF